jgi:hypothetical protein
LLCFIVLTRPPIALSTVVRSGKRAPAPKKPEPKDLASVLERELAFEREDTTSAGGWQ